MHQLSIVVCAAASSKARPLRLDCICISAMAVSWCNFGRVPSPSGGISTSPGYLMLCVMAPTACHAWYYRYWHVSNLYIRP
jgi:hypothetical protein